MNNSKPSIPAAKNEPVLDYAPGSPERVSLQNKLRELKQDELEIPALIGGKALYTGDLQEIRPPHELSHRLGIVHKCGAKEAQQAIEASQDAWQDWANMDF
ncbi:MAG: 1-pyrroline-5-carboxylate dehydrogenase, partial [Bacteroidota bacterium]|nr:1-pyrroline-5-carboxylate dehydrogenase [Bacteroidota bacterium]